VRLAPQRRRQQSFSLEAKRRREIVLHARHVGAAETEDFSRWLIAWLWHNPRAKDQIWSVMECARNMGGKITEREASAVIKEASTTRKHLSADDLARFLGVTFEQRQALHLTTIGSIDVGRRARKELRKRRDRLYRERKRRAAGARPRTEYEANSLSKTQPWSELGKSRRTWERRRNKARDASVSAAIFLSSDDRPASPAGKAGPSERRCRAEEKKEDFRLATATTLVADLYATLPLELRMAALCLPMLEKLARAA
jgi:hypothetical protein